LWPLHLASIRSTPARSEAKKHPARILACNTVITAPESIAGDVLASLTTPIWNIPSKAWTGGAVIADASLNRRMTVRLGPSVASARIGIIGFDRQIEALRLYGLLEATPALLYALHRVRHRRLDENTIRPRGTDPMPGLVITHSRANSAPSALYAPPQRRISMQPAGGSRS
jgi:hypothetical protein